jgi:hypothetical protein
MELGIQHVILVVVVGQMGVRETGSALVDMVEQQRLHKKHDLTEQVNDGHKT